MDRRCLKWPSYGGKSVVECLEALQMKPFKIPYMQDPYSVQSVKEVDQSSHKK